MILILNKNSFVDNRLGYIDPTFDNLEHKNTVLIPIHFLKSMNVSYMYLIFQSYHFIALKFVEKLFLKLLKIFFITV